MSRRRHVAVANLGRGPVSAHGHTIAIRSPRYADFRTWQAIRLRDQALIEPFWITSPLSWTSRHDAASWVRQQLRNRSAARARRMLPIAIEVDGEFAGEFNLYSIDWQSRSAEMGIWMDSRASGHSISAIAGALVVEYAFAELGLHRLTAPICVDNPTAAIVAARGGMICEATMVNALNVGGRLRDHNLWAMTSDRRPPDGFLADVMRTWGLPYPSDDGAEPPPPDHRSHRNPDKRKMLVAAGRYYVGEMLRRARGLTVEPAPPGPAPVSVNGHEVRLRATRASSGSAEDGRAIDFIVDLDGREAGHCELREHGQGHSVAEFDFHFDWDAVDFDSAVATIQLVGRYAMDDLRLARLSCTIDPIDSRAATLMGRADFTKEGTMTGARRAADGSFHDLDLWAQTGRSTDGVGDARRA